MQKKETKVELLVIDDDPVVRHILSSILSLEGYRVILAESGEAGLSILADAVRDKRAPNVIMLDFKLPGKSGVEVLKEVRTLTENLRVPVIMLSANTREELLQDGFVISPDFYLEKPFQAEMVLSVIQLALGMSRD